MYFRAATAALCIWFSAGAVEAAGGALGNEQAATAARPELSDGVAAMKRGKDFIAFTILERFADQGYRAAQSNLATLYLHGRGTGADPQTARRLYEEAAGQGLTLAMSQLASIHQNGIGVERDPAKALDWYRRGAALGDPQCLFGLALMYQNGAGVAANEKEAAKFYRMAALRGHAKAQFMLGVMTYQGRGVKKDLIEAYKWFARAQSSLPPGTDRERSIRAVSLIEATLTAEQIAEAKASAADLRADAE